MVDYQITVASAAFVYMTSRGYALLVEVALGTTLHIIIEFLQALNLSFISCIFIFVCYIQFNAEGQLFANPMCFQSPHVNQDDNEEDVTPKH